MCDCGRGEGREVKEGRVSRRYIRMKPRMRERPTHAWGVLCDISGGTVVVSGADEDEGEEPMMWTSSPEVTVFGGWESFSRFRSPGITGPGVAENAEVSAPSSSSLLLCKICNASPFL